ncbi:hypothetical protein HGB41_12360 [Massilia sp. ML15P13]|uniref:DUF4189 domain-containing protein n=2 Tax=Telluria aromaticivorans TaxID=2725995 RepID=A0A7Y2NZE0_9BURK|nr:hypothetical protein [Telluria aromaticivorans]
MPGEDGAMHKLLLLLMLGCTACTSQAQDPGRKTAVPSPSTAAAPSTPLAEGQDSLARLRAAIGSAACTESGQCRSLPVGARACGGPEAYLAFSTAGGKEAALRVLAEQHQKERQAANARSGMMSTCQFMPDPGAVCTAGTCQLGTANPAS